jgi:hypothetical protein
VAFRSQRRFAKPHYEAAKQSRQWVELPIGRPHIRVWRAGFAAQMSALKEYRSKGT